VVIESDKTKEKGLNIALNKVSGFWDKELLAELLLDLQSLDYDVFLTGFDQVEIDKLFSGVNANEIQEDDFDVDEALNAQGGYLFNHKKINRVLHFLSVLGLFVSKSIMDLVCAVLFNTCAIMLYD